MSKDIYLISFEIHLSLSNLIYTWPVFPVSACPSLAYMSCKIVAFLSWPFSRPGPMCPWPLTTSQMGRIRRRFSALVMPCRCAQLEYSRHCGTQCLETCRPTIFTTSSCVCLYIIYGWLVLLLTYHVLKRHVGLEGQPCKTELWIESGSSLRGGRVLLSLLFPSTAWKFAGLIKHGPLLPCWTSGLQIFHVGDMHCCLSISSKNNRLLWKRAHWQMNSDDFPCAHVILSSSYLQFPEAIYLYLSIS